MTTNVLPPPTFGGLGYNLDPNHDINVASHPLRDERVGLIKAAAPYANKRDWRDVIGNDVLSQGQSSVCVIMSLAESILHSSLVDLYFGRGPAVPMPSVRHWYAQYQWEVSPLAPIVDNGADSPTACTAAEKGLVAESRWPFDPSKASNATDALAYVSEPLPFDLDIAAWDARLTGWHMADGDADPLSAMYQALDMGHFPCIALDVYANFMFASPSLDLYEGIEGDFMGRHQVECVAYEVGKGILIRNTWTKGWGQDGHLWLSEGFLRSKNVLARTVVTAAPATR